MQGRACRPLLRSERCIDDDHRVLRLAHGNAAERRNLAGNAARRHGITPVRRDRELQHHIVESHVLAQ